MQPTLNAIPTALENPPTRNAQERLVGIELLRFISAFAVLIFHYQHFAFFDAKIDPNFNKSLLPGYSALWPFYLYGYHAVDIFWCISGYIFFYKYSAAISKNKITAYKFLIYRMSRLYPLHIATLIIVAILTVIYWHMFGAWFVYANNDLTHLLLHLTYTTNWFSSANESFNGPAWSISVEVAVYFLFFQITRRFRDSFKTITLALLAALLLRQTHFMRPVFDCMALFYAGGLASKLMIYTATREPGNRTLLKSAITLLALLAVSAVVAESTNYHVDFMVTLIGTPLLIYLLSIGQQIHAGFTKIIILLANLTYGSYLLHYPVQLCFVITFGALNQPVPVNSAVLLLSYISVTLTLAYFSFYYFESPMQRVLRQFFIK